MARAGCIAVTGGLECADDRLLKLMNKGITCASAKRVLKRFRSAEIAVQAQASRPALKANISFAYRM